MEFIDIKGFEIMLYDLKVVNDNSYIISVEYF